MKLKRLVVGLVGAALAFSLTGYAFAASPKSFRDVPSSHWAHDAIMEMAALGMFTGTTEPDADGVGTFAPGAPMSGAEFIAVITRFLYPGELAATEPGAAWYANNYRTALRHALITEDLFPESTLTRPITRQEAAYVLANALGALGEETGSLIGEGQIPDCGAIDEAYLLSVRIAYTKGLITGTDSKGTFQPTGTLNRDQAAAVVYRLINPEHRKPTAPGVPEDCMPGPADFPKLSPGASRGLPDYLWVYGDEWAVDIRTGTNHTLRGGGSYAGKLTPSSQFYIGEVPSENQTWVEGEIHGIPQAGDTVIKKDGTRVVLKLTTFDDTGDLWLLGFGQGVDIITGTTINGYTTQVGRASWYDQTPYQKFDVTGEVYSRQQWIRLRSRLYPAGLVGEYDGQMYPPYFQWNSKMDEWKWIGP